MSGNHSYSQPGVYSVRVTITDDDGASGEMTFHYLVIFDPSSGFVTGGWFTSRRV